MMPLDPVKRRRLVAALRLLNSDNEGERSAALQAVTRLLPPGASIADLVGDAPAPPRPKMRVPDFRIVGTAWMGAGR
jgi:hypothetical protein